MNLFVTGGYNIKTCNRQFFKTTMEPKRAKSICSILFYYVCQILLKNGLEIRQDFKGEMLNKNLLVAIESGEASQRS